jgi:lipopolysaccharide/colanic/teichoic acid biosynthesis glycosyltransferase
MCSDGGNETVRKRILLLVSDLTVILTATILAILLRDNFETNFARFEAMGPYLKATAFASVPLLCLFGLDRAIWRMSALRDYLFVAAAAVAIVMLAVGTSFTVNRLDGVSRSLPILQVLLMICGLVGIRILARLRYRTRSRLRLSQPFSAHSQAVPYENILVIGLGRVAELYVQAVDEFGGGAKRIVGVLSLAERHTGRLLHQYPVLGPTEQIESILRDLEVHGVFVHRIVVSFPFKSLPLLARHSILETTTKSDIVLECFAEQFEPRPLDTGVVHLQQQRLESAPSETSGPSRVLPNNTVYWSIKRAIDVSAAFAMILVLIPVFVGVACCVAMDIGIPLLFWQQRPGVGKKPFRVYKFRTMRGAFDWHGRRVVDELRSSSIGRILRRTRLDELPQLINILRGQMSFVGPRPLLQVDQCTSTATRLLIRPGLTGWAQVNGGRLLSIPDKMALDLWYVQHASFAVDCKVIVRTVAMVLFGEKRNDAEVRRANLWLKSLTTAAIPPVPLKPIAVQTNPAPIPFDINKRQVA